MNKDLDRWFESLDSAGRYASRENGAVALADLLWRIRARLRLLVAWALGLSLVALALYALGHGLKYTRIEIKALRS